MEQTSLAWLKLVERIALPALAVVAGFQYQTLQGLIANQPAIELRLAFLEKERDSMNVRTDMANRDRLEHQLKMIDQLARLDERIVGLTAAINIMSRKKDIIFFR